MKYVPGKKDIYCWRSKFGSQVLHDKESIMSRMSRLLRRWSGFLLRRGLWPKFQHLFQLRIGLNNPDFHPLTIHQAEQLFTIIAFAVGCGPETGAVAVNLAHGRRRQRRKIKKLRAHFLRQFLFHGLVEGLKIRSSSVVPDHDYLLPLS